MILNQKLIDHDHWGDEFSIYCIGDVHLGNKVCDLAKLKRDVEFVKNEPLAYWIGMGDYIEAINYSDKRFDPTQISEKYLVENLSNICKHQFEDIMEIFSPIMHKCLGMHRGNHEESIRHYHHFDLMYEVKRDYPEIQMLEDTAFTRLTFRRHNHSVQTFILWTAHGNVAGRKSGTKINRIEEAMGWFDADVYILAHGHRKVFTSATQLGIKKAGKMFLRAKRRVGGMTGSYFKTYQEGTSTYGEKKMFSPSDLGCIKILIKPAHESFYLSEVN